MSISYSKPGAPTASAERGSKRARERHNEALELELLIVHHSPQCTGFN